MARILTGIQSTNIPHLGNILGAIVPAIEMSKQTGNESLFFIADLHSLTTIKDAAFIKESTDAVAATWLAFGFDTDKNIFYRQSKVTEVCELTWYLNCYTPFPMLANAHSFKDKSERLADVNAGLFTYPVLMAADILLYDANFVPVGKDQLQHLEMTRDIGEKFNHAMGETLWNSLTITGVIEARGRALCDAQAPDFQTIIEEDVTATTVGHLNKGLLYAHGLDEGGNPAAGEGGHDDMWFAVRDALFGKNAFPLPEVPGNIGRPEIGRLMPQLDKAYEDWILLLMNVLMIEVRAESFFAFCTNIMRSPEVFRDRRAAAAHAAELVERIRTDEAIHVAYLQAFVSEMRSFTIKGKDGNRIKGATLIDPIWEGMINWHSVIQADFSREQGRQAIKTRISKRPDGHALLAQFDALEHKAAA